MEVDLRNAAAGQVVINTTTPVTVLLDPFGVYELSDGRSMASYVHYGVNGTPPVADLNETAANRGWLTGSGFDTPAPVPITGCDRVSLLASAADTTVLIRLVGSRPRV